MTTFRILCNNVKLNCFMNAFCSDCTESYNSPSDLHRHFFTIISIISARFHLFSIFHSIDNNSYSTGQTSLTFSYVLFVSVCVRDCVPVYITTLSRLNLLLREERTLRSDGAGANCLPSILHYLFGALD